MKAELENFNTGWYGIFIEMYPSEVDRLVHLLTQLRSGEINHFHFYSDFSNERGIGDVEFSLQSTDQENNLYIE